MSQKPSFIEFARTELTASLRSFFDAIKNNDFFLSIAATLIFILFILLIGSFNNSIVPLFPLPHYHYILESNPLAFLSNWDGPNYLRIAHFNYNSVFDAGFYPLYPALTYFFSFVFRSFLISALLISWMSLFGAIYFLIKILRHLRLVATGSDALKATAIFILFPTGIFLFASYTESLFCFLSLGAVYMALKTKWQVSALLLILVGSTHEMGVMVAALVALILLEEKTKIWKSAIALISGFIGLGVFMAFQEIKYGNPLEFIKSQAKIHFWTHHGLGYLLSSTNFLEASSVLLVILSGIYFWKKRLSFSLYSLSFLIIPLVGGQYGGFNRYVLTAFPIEFMVYDYCRKHLKSYPYILALTAMLWTLTAIEYMGGYVGS